MMTSSNRACRSCGLPLGAPFLSLGPLPLSVNLLTATELDRPESRYPLDVAWCAACGLVQLLDTVDPVLLFCHDHPYYSSSSPATLQRSQARAQALIAARGLGAKSLVVEIGSNDGYLLRYFAEQGIPVLGVDPAVGPAQSANAKGVSTRTEFFTRDFAVEALRQIGQADLILGNNVLAHVSDPANFAAGVAAWLKPGGLAVFEVLYLGDLMELGEFETIYHEQNCYFSLRALQRLFAHVGLQVCDVERLAIHGGSLRVSVNTGTRYATDAVGALVAEEERRGMTRPAYYTGFAEVVERRCRDLRIVLQAKKTVGQTLAAYGHTAKGGTLLNTCGLGRETFDFLADRSTAKHGYYTSGSHLPIVPVEQLLERMPNYTLILTWQFAEEILKQQTVYRRAGGKFLLPIPTVREAL